MRDDIVISREIAAQSWLLRDWNLNIARLEFDYCETGVRLLRDRCSAIARFSRDDVTRTLNVKYGDKRFLAAFLYLSEAGVMRTLIVITSYFSFSFPIAPQI